MSHHGRKDRTIVQDRRPAVVIDTNVLVDAMVAWIDPQKASNRNRDALFVLEQSFSRYRVCFSRSTMQEFCEVALDLKAKTRIRPTQAMHRVNFIKYVEARMTTVEPRPSTLKCQDRKDQMFLEVAQGCNARHIISADNDILRLRREGRCDFVHPVAMAMMLSSRIHEEFERSKRHGKPYVAFGQPNKGGFIKQYGQKPAKKKAAPAPYAQKSDSNKPK